MGRLLNQIKEPNDIKRISPKLYPVLAEEIRDFLLNNVSQTGGHLASNLGAVGRRWGNGFRYWKF